MICYVLRLGVATKGLLQPSEENTMELQELAQISSLTTRLHKLDLHRRTLAAAAKTTPRKLSWPMKT
jgi:hypothetical protein